MFGRQPRKLLGTFVGTGALIAASFAAAHPAAAVPGAPAAISFGKSQLSGEISTRPTTLQCGPDGRLYVLQQDGMLYIYSGRPQRRPTTTG